jgi:Ca-activated chloride channel family protein
MDNNFQSDDPSPHLPAGPSLNGEPYDDRSLITAFALGELSEAERFTVAGRLNDSTAERQHADEISRLGQLLRKVAADLPLPERSAELHEAVVAALANPPVEPPLRLPERFPRRGTWLRLSLAASLLVVGGTLVVLTRMKHLERAIARRDAVLARNGAAAEGVDEMVDISEQLDLTLGIDEPDGRQPGALVASPHAGEGWASGSFSSVRTEAISDLPAGLEVADENLEYLSSVKGTGDGPGMMDGRAGRRNARPYFFDPGKASGTARVQGAGFGSMSGPGQRANRGPGGGSGGGQLDGSSDGALLVGGRELPDAAETSSSSSNLQQGAIRGRPYFAASKALLDASTREVSGEQGGQDGGGKSGGGQRPHREGEVIGQNEQILPGMIVGTGVPPNSEAQSDAAGGRQGRWFYTLSDLRAGYGGIALPNTESYAPLIENPFRKPTEYPLSTFSVDVDTASYTNVRRFLSSRAMPPPDAVRVEELINYFQFGYPQPEGNVPFSITSDVADCPWNAEHRLLRVGLKGRDVPADQRPASNLVFLLDVSGSMEAANKLPLVKEAMYRLTDKLTENDRVAIVVYAGNSGLVLPPTNGTNKAAIRNAIGQLVARGSTNGGQGLQMAYDTAQSQFIQGGTNRVILATDGDFNVGIVDQSDLVKLIEEKAKSGVYLSALGFGVGNLKDGTLEKLADKGNGNYAYIDTLGEARRVLVEQLSGTLVTIAKDVKLQIEFNPAQAAEYRLIGYENRALPPQDFSDDRKDAGEIGAGHTVTALYEIMPAAQATAAGEEPLKYQRSEQLTPAAISKELATIKLRYKLPEANESRLIERVVHDRRPEQAAASGDFSFAAAVAEFGMLLRKSPYRGGASFESVLALAELGLANDTNGYRSEFIELVRQARDISGQE